MNLLEIRGNLIAHAESDFKAQFPSVPIVWGNSSFDRNAPPEVYLEASVQLEDSEQVALNSSVSRHYGTIYFTAITKKGIGTKVSCDVLAWLENRYKHAIIDGHQCKTPYFSGEAPSPKGYEMNLNVPFTTRAI